MKNFYFRLIALLMLALPWLGARATAWPTNYEGVMLQGFYWDSYDDTKWTNLTAQADELSKYFKLIWVPNSARSAGQPSMGYMPIYWFTNHNSSFGNEGQLRTMIRTFKDKGVGIIADVVVNHRVGVSGWADFPTETWNGQTWQMGPEAVCSNDEWGQGKGARDTGENFDGARDLDHTNANVQNNVKNYFKFLLEDLGYVGFRLDMVKGYGGEFTKIYNQYSKPQFSVGEYWDGSYDRVSAWIEATGKESAAFDFPFKYAVNEAFSQGNMSKLCWKANGTTDQPAGLIHYGYPQYAVTFIENHDTSRDGSKFTGNVLAANAFMLCSPGTPCVYLRHYLDNKAAIQALINIRNAVGVHNMSQVTVLQATPDCYMAEVTGTKGKLVIKVGPSMVSPNGYSDSDIKASGNDYCVWTKVGGIDIPEPDPVPTGPFKVYFQNTKSWTTPHIHYWGGEESKWPGNPMTLVGGDIWEYTVPVNTTGILFNAGDGDDTKTADMNAHENHLYSPDGDKGLYNGYNANFPEKLYLLGHVSGYNWSTSQGLEAIGNNGVYEWKDVTVDDAGGGYGYFSFTTALGASWDEVNSYDRYGSNTADEPISNSQSGNVMLYGANVNASAAKSWMIVPGKYDINVNLNIMQLGIGIEAAVENIGFDEDAPAEYYNLQGIRVMEPTHGIYICRKGNKTYKTVIR